jgi:hypothetical protein
MIEVPAKLACGRLRASAANQTCRQLHVAAFSYQSPAAPGGMRVILPFVKVGDSVQRSCS